MSWALAVHELSVAYASALILSDASLEVREGETVSLVGPNGAGKTTLLRAVAGLIRWEQKVLRKKDVWLSGEVWFRGERLDHLLPHEIAARGLILCPERRRVLPEMSVRDNLIAGAYLVKDRRTVEERLSEIFALFPILKERSRKFAGTLSGGEQQMLAIGRALMSGPKLLCIDEPSTSLAPLVKQSLFERIRKIKELGIAVLLVEQDASLSFSLSQRGYVLSQGRIVAEGPCETLIADDVVRRSYLGL